MHRMHKTYIIRIEWDVEREQLVLVKPKGLTKEKHTYLPYQELKMDHKTKVKDCIYFNAKTGEGYATAGRGKWYNMMLFMHLMQKN